MIGKCKALETKNSCWAGELVTIYTMIPPSSLTGIDKDLTVIPKLFLQEADPHPIPR